MQGEVSLACLEEVADAAGADADEHFDEVGAGDGEEGHVGLAGDGLGEEGLAACRGRRRAARRGGCARRVAGSFLGFLRNSTISVDLFLGLVDAGDVGEGDVGVFLGEEAVAGAAEVAEHADAAAGGADLAEEEEPDDEEDEEPGDELDEDLDEEGVAGLIS